MENKQLKKECDGVCSTCPMAWQIQCGATYGYMNNQNQKAIVESIELLRSELLELKNNLVGQDLPNNPVSLIQQKELSL